MLNAAANGTPFAQVQDGPPYFVDLHVNPGESVLIQMTDGNQTFLCGPATIKMVSDLARPPVPLPLSVPPGKIVQQITDEHGTLRHIIVSALNNNSVTPPTVPQHQQRTWHVDGSNPYGHTASPFGTCCCCAYCAPAAALPQPATHSPQTMPALHNGGGLAIPATRPSVVGRRRTPPTSNGSSNFPQKGRLPTSTGPLVQPVAVVSNGLCDPMMTNHHLHSSVGMNPSSELILTKSKKLQQPSARSQHLSNKQQLQNNKHQQQHSLMSLPPNPPLPQHPPPPPVAIATDKIAMDYASTVVTAPSSLSVSPMSGYGSDYCNSSVDSSPPNGGSVYGGSSGSRKSSAHSAAHDSASQLGDELMRSDSTTKQQSDSSVLSTDTELSTMEVSLADSFNESDSSKQQHGSHIHVGPATPRRAGKQQQSPTLAAAGKAASAAATRPSSKEDESPRPTAAEGKAGINKQLSSVGGGGGGIDGSSPTSSKHGTPKSRNSPAKHGSSKHASTAATDIRLQSDDRAKPATRGSPASSSTSSPKNTPIKKSPANQKPLGTAAAAVAVTDEPTSATNLMNGAPAGYSSGNKQSDKCKPNETSAKANASCSPINITPNNSSKAAAASATVFSVHGSQVTSTTTLVCAEEDEEQLIVVDVVKEDKCTGSDTSLDRLSSGRSQARKKSQQSRSSASSSCSSSRGSRTSSEEKLPAPVIVEESEDQVDQCDYPRRGATPISEQNPKSADEQQPTTHSLISKPSPQRSPKHLLPQVQSLNLTYTALTATSVKLKWTWLNGHDSPAASGGGGSKDSSTSLFTRQYAVEMVHSKPNSGGVAGGATSLSADLGGRDSASGSGNHSPAPSTRNVYQGTMNTCRVAHLSCQQQYAFRVRTIQEDRALVSNLLTITTPEQPQTKHKKKQQAFLNQPAQLSQRDSQPQPGSHGPKSSQSNGISSNHLAVDEPHESALASDGLTAIMILLLFTLLAVIAAVVIQQLVV